jgi:uncharacterized protein (DUF362 family)
MVVKPMPTDRRVERPGREPLNRREFFERSGAGLLLSLLGPSLSGIAASPALNDLFSVEGIPDDPFTLRDNHHSGLDALLFLMGANGLKFYRSPEVSPLGGPRGLLAPDDVVVLKVNAQWKYRGSTNTDLVRGLVQRILDHPAAFTGEVVIVENGQGRGSLACDTWAAYGNSAVHANANDESHSFLHLVDRVFHDPRVSAFRLDPIRTTFLAETDHATDGYRRFENVSYPCFTTPAGNRIELKLGVWRDGAFRRNLKLINVPVLKHHDIGGSEITASLKHFYGLLSMSDGMSGFRHYAGLGETCGRMAASVATPVLNIVDAIWVSHGSLKGYPESTTRRLNRIAASQDPVALDSWAARHLLFPIDGNFRHHPDHPNIDAWLAAARDTINGLGGLVDEEKGIVVDQVTKDESRIRVLSGRAFTGNERLLAVTADFGGTTDPAPGLHVFAPGARVPVSAAPRPGFEFAGWRGDLGGTRNPSTILMDSNKSIGAEFERKVLSRPESRARR